VEKFNINIVYYTYLQKLLAVILQDPVSGGFQSVRLTTVLRDHHCNQAAVY